MRRTRYHLLGAAAFLLPALLIFLAFTLYPFVLTCVQSVFTTNAKGDLVGFSGLDNYIRLFQSTIYRISLKNTIVYIFLTVPGTIVLSLAMALLTSSDRKGMGIFRTIFTFTMGISVAAASMN